MFFLSRSRILEPNITICFLFSWRHKKRREISALTFVLALTQCAVVSYTFYSSWILAPYLTYYSTPNFTQFPSYFRIVIQGGVFRQSLDSIGWSRISEWISKNNKREGLTSYLTLSVKKNLSNFLIQIFLLHYILIIHCV